MKGGQVIYTLPHKNNKQIFLKEQNVDVMIEVPIERIIMEIITRIWREDKHNGDTGKIAG